VKPAVRANCASAETVTYFRLARFLYQPEACEALPGTGDEKDSNFTLLVRTECGIKTSQGKENLMSGRVCYGFIDLRPQDGKWLRQICSQVVEVYYLDTGKCLRLIDSLRNKEIYPIHLRVFGWFGAKFGALISILKSSFLITSSFRDTEICHLVSFV